MSQHLWAVSEDGTIEYQQLTKPYLDKSIALIAEAFYPYENVCRSIGVAKNPEAVKELEGLLVDAAKSGVSLIAVEKSSDKVVGVAFNKIVVKEPIDYYVRYMESCKCPESRAILEFLSKMDELCDLFDLNKIDCLLELMFLSTSPESRGKGIGRKLTEITIEIATKLLNGVNVKKPLDEGQELTLEPVPKIVSAIYTSFITQKIGRQLGFEVPAEDSYENYDYQGKTYSSVIGDETPTVQIAYKKL